ncbi:MAG: Alpha-glucuronidase [Mucilaginibacter sp.]|nr:Alpha-glucuronidase [Mucilaginibacter sp.]
MALKKLTAILIFSVCFVNVFAENGYDLWIRYKKIDDPSLLSSYRAAIRQIILSEKSPILQSAGRELNRGISGLLQIKPVYEDRITINGTLLIGTPQSQPLIARLPIQAELKNIGDEGYLLRSITIDGKQCTVITANTDAGVLYGVFNFLRLIQTHQSLQQLAVVEKPTIKYRVLDHWDNLDGTIERGYAGSSLWDWQRLPGYIDKRYEDYARADASVGINGAVLNNVNAKAKSLSAAYIIKTAALADVFRKYGIRVYLTARFTAPMELGKLKTADPLDADVKKWWKDKADEVYKYIPDFGGFLIKANSEGQPGPQDYKRTHADGANTLAEAVTPHGGIVIWRAFVYANHKDADRAKQAYDEFKPLDGKFISNVFLQVKNGPIDFQPREAIHPLFGAMPKTPLALEVEITQEYLGFASHLVYLAPLIKETLDADTYSKGEGSTVSKIIDGSLDHHQLSCIAGVANTGSDINWCGHPFAQANWYAFGRLAWNPDLGSSQIADEWLRMTFSNDKSFIEPVKKIMLDSREAAVNYMMPMGLNHIMNLGTHYGPGPWDKIPGWNAWDYHRADSVGLGFNRTSTGSNAVSQYFAPLSNQYENIKTTPPKYLLWFHHVGWNYKMPSGKIFWDELVDHYYAGVNAVRAWETTWEKQKTKVDPERFEEVKQLLAQQEKEAIWWRDGSILYFQTYSHLPIPAGYEKPQHELKYYETITFP